MLPQPAHPTGVNAVTSNIDVKCPLHGQWLELQPQQQWTVKIPVYISRDCPFPWDRQSGHNIEVRSRNTVRREKAIKCYIFRVCVYSSLSYPACISHLFCTVFYCHQWPVCFHCILHIIPQNGIIFRKPLLNIEMFFDFLYNFCLKHFSF